MAISSRRPRRPGIDIWPGFVDALSQLVMVIVFVLLIFTAGQFYLTDALSGRDAALRKLTQQINELTDLLSLERKAADEARLNVTTLSTELQAATAARDDLTTRVAALAARAEDEKARADRAVSALNEATQTVSVDKEKVDLQLREIESLKRDLEALRKIRFDLEAKAVANAADLTAARDRSKELEAKLSTAEERTALAQKSIDERDVRLNAAQGNIDALNQQLAALRVQLQKIASLLDATDAKNKDQEVQIADLGRRLNAALATKVEELARFRSEFFGRLRQILGDRPDIRVVGDRFVFQSEVLFDRASADLSDQSKTQLLPVATALKEIAAKIPADIPWVLRVDGHTDRRPIATQQFPSNWELSTARAISVVKYLVDQGIPTTHLVAAGFGEYQPLDAREDEVAYRRNRRIELKL